MGNALLLSPAYGWFIGLLVVMIVVTGLFALILFIALKPVNKEIGGEDVSYAKALLGRREAEITSEIMKNQGNVDAMDKLLSKLKEVTAAEKLIDELVDGTSEQVTAPVKPPKAAAAAASARPVRPAPARTPAAAAKPRVAPAKPAAAETAATADNSELKDE